jgi:hypothetical protein
VAPGALVGFLTYFILSKTSWNEIKQEKLIDTAE